MLPIFFFLIWPFSHSSYCKDDQSLLPNHPADQVTLDHLHLGASSVTHRTISLGPKRAHPSAVSKVSSRRGSKDLSSSSESIHSSFSGRRPSLFVKFKKSGIFPNRQQSRANFDSQEKGSFSDLKYSSNHFGVRSQGLFSAPRLSIISCYNSTSFFDLQSRGHKIFNPDEIEAVSKSSSMAGAEKYLSPCSPKYNIGQFMSFETKANSSTHQNAVDRSIYQHGTAALLSLPTLISYSCQQSEIATDPEERGQSRKVDLHPGSQSHRIDYFPPRMQQHPSQRVTSPVFL